MIYADMVLVGVKLAKISKAFKVAIVANSL